MTRRRIFHTVLVLSVTATLSGCAFGGLNSLPLPGTEGAGAARPYTTLRSPMSVPWSPDSPVMVDDVVVGSVGKI